MGRGPGWKVVISKPLDVWMKGTNKKSLQGGRFEPITRSVDRYKWSDMGVVPIHGRKEMGLPGVMSPL